MLNFDCAIGNLISLINDENYPGSTPQNGVISPCLVAQSSRLMALVVPYYGTSSTYEGY